MTSSGSYPDISKRKRAITQWFRDFKKELVCVKCGFSHPAALDFHHLDPSTKVHDPAQMASYGWSRKRILEEIGRCAVLCANCHRVLHHEERMRVSSNSKAPVFQTGNAGA